MLIMALLRNGHQRIFEYGYEYFTIATEELELHNREHLVDLAYAHRVSKLNNEKWKEFVKDNMPKVEKKADPKVKKAKKQMTKDEHLAVIRRLKGLG